jgi:hypothetical protein
MLGLCLRFSKLLIWAQIGVRQQLKEPLQVGKLLVVEEELQ